MNQAVEGIVTVAGLVIGLAIVAVLVSRNAQTADVIKAGGGTFADVIKAAVGPVSGSSGNAGLATSLGNAGGIFASNGQYLGE